MTGLVISRWPWKHMYRKFGFLDGTIIEIVPPVTESDWNTVIVVLVSWIMNTVDHVTCESIEM